MLPVVLFFFGGAGKSGGADFEEHVVHEIFLGRISFFPPYFKGTKDGDPLLSKLVGEVGGVENTWKEPNQKTYTNRDHN